MLMWRTLVQCPYPLPRHHEPIPVFLPTHRNSFRMKMKAFHTLNLRTRDYSVRRKIRHNVFSSLNNREWWAQRRLRWTGGSCLGSFEILETEIRSLVLCIYFPCPGRLSDNYSLLRETEAAMEKPLCRKEFRTLLQNWVKSEIVSVDRNLPFSDLLELFLLKKKRFCGLLFIHITKTSESGEKRK